MISLLELMPAAAAAVCTPMHLVLRPRPSVHVGALYLGSLSATLEPGFLAAHNISAVVRVMDSPFIAAQDPHAPVEMHRIDIGDSAAVDIRPHLEGAVQWIDERRKHGQNVLVHCQHGISRSASIVLAYLIRTLNVSYDVAFTFLQSKRACIKPNAGFAVYV
ncbi:DSPc-domain-containing protein [Obba rivulosa]|uniref:protein-tyrosine-phosphatase n=1 Tax=Obba rivulosa TaxID=1052685 RepID=A0A8E2AW51_9APHY|nr:DSPc-domain-containing protein [Obba rivulosa]